MAVLLLVAAQGWSGFNLYVGKLPLPGLLAIIGITDDTQSVAMAGI